MKRTMLDTSVYGKLLEDSSTLEEFGNSVLKFDYLLYGASIIRKELRATPKSATLGSGKLRILLLNLYDKFIVRENQDLKFNKLIETLSKDYFTEYKRNRGSLSSEAMANDFIIIATATIYRLDLVVSDDERTMLSEASTKSYKNVNRKYGLRDPELKKYTAFKRELTR